MFTFQVHFLTVSRNAVDYQDGKNYVNNWEVSFPLNSISDRITPTGPRGKEMSWGLLKRVKLLLKIILAIGHQNNEIRHDYFYHYVSISCVFCISSRVLGTTWRLSQPDSDDTGVRGRRSDLAPAPLTFSLSFPDWWWFVPYSAVSGTGYAPSRLDLPLKTPCPPWCLLNSNSPLDPQCPLS